MLPTLLVFLTVAVNGAGYPQGAPALPAEVTAALRSNADQLEGLYISGSSQRKLLGEPQVTLKELGTPAPESEFTQRVLFQLILGGDRLSEQLRYPPSRFTPPDSVTEQSFDSEKWYSGSATFTGDRRGGILSIHTPQTLTAKDGTHVRVFNLWYAHDAGFEGPQVSTDLGKRLGSRILDNIGRGSLASCGSRQLDGHPIFEVTVVYPDPWMSTDRSDIEKDPRFQVLLGESKSLQMRIERERRTLVGTNRIGRFALDPALNYAVIQFQETRERSGDLMFVTRNSDFVDLGNGLWLPQKCETTSYAWVTRPVFCTKTPAYLTTITADTIERRAFSAKDFQVWFDIPGVAVSDYTQEKARPGEPFRYFVPGPIDQGMRGNLWRTILISVNVIIAIGLIAYLVWRRARGRAKLSSR